MFLHDFLTMKRSTSVLLSLGALYMHSEALLFVLACRSVVLLL